MEIVKLYVGELVRLVNEMAPYLLLGFLFAGILRVFFPQRIIATMAVIGNAMGKKSLWIYLATLIGGALLFGSMINELVPREWIMRSIALNLHGDRHEHPAGWLQWISSAVLVLLIVNGYIMKYLYRRKHRMKDNIKGTSKNYFLLRTAAK